MSASRDALPPGYLHVSAFRRRAVVRAREADDVRGVLAQGTTLHDWAAGLPERREYVGREFAYGVELPRSRTAVVVRHARHGGALQAVTRDLWLGAGRAAHELATSVRLRAAGVLTPHVVGYAVEIFYP